MWFLPALSIVFVIAKLIGLIDWSWWLVFAPVYGPVGLWLAIMFIIYIFVSVVNFFIVLFSPKPQFYRPRRKLRFPKYRFPF